MQRVAIEFWVNVRKKLLETFLGNLEQLVESPTCLVGFRLIDDFITTFWYPENFLYLPYY